MPSNGEHEFQGKLRTYLGGGACPRGELLRVRGGLGVQWRRRGQPMRRQITALLAKTAACWPGMGTREKQRHTGQQTGARQLTVSVKTVTFGQRVVGQLSSSHRDLQSRGHMLRISIRHHS